MALSAVVALGAASPAGAVVSSKPDTTFVTDATVNAVARTANRIYLGGAFHRVGPRTGPWAAISATSGNFDAAMPQVSGSSGEVEAVIPDGSGGFYIGGFFTHIGGVPRNNVAHVRADKTVDPNWNPNVSQGVHVLARSGSTVYIGGQFFGTNSINGNQTRNYAAAVDAVTGTIKSWNPNLNSDVRAIVVSGSKVYLGGDFNGSNSINGNQTRNYAAAVDATTGAVDAWDANLDSYVYAIAVNGSAVYLGGEFTKINGPAGPPRAYAAAVDTTNGTDTGWNPTLNNYVYTIRISGSTVYLGGEFNGPASINGPAGPIRNYAAAVDATTGTANGWNPNLNSSVLTLIVSGSIVYLGGDFNGSNSINGNQTRDYLAAVDAGTGAVGSWNPRPTADVRALALAGSTIAAGGDFASLGGEERNHAAALNAADGKLTGWNPNISSTVNALRVSGSTVYIGGVFSGPSSVNGNTLRNHAAAVDATTGAVKPWDPNINGTVNALALSGTTVYLGGSFNGVNSVNGNTLRNRAAAVDATSGAVKDWDPNLTGAVNTLKVSGATVYLGGSFNGANSVNGNTLRNRAAAVDATTGLVKPWDPNLKNGTVNALALSGSTVYIGGRFVGLNSVNGNTLRNRAAAVDATTGLVKPWDPNINDTVRALAVAGSTVYIGGDFFGADAVNGSLTRSGLAQVDATTGTATAWNPGTNRFGGVVALATDGGGGLVAGGSFRTLNLGAQEGIGVFSAPPANLVRPKVPGTGKVGKTLSCSTGKWTGSPPLAFAYR